MRTRLLIAALGVVIGFAPFAFYRLAGRQASGDDYDEVGKPSLAPPDGHAVVPNRPGDHRNVDKAPLAPPIDIDLRGLTRESLKQEMTKHIIKKDVGALTKWLAANGVAAKSYEDVNSIDIGGAPVYERAGLARNSVVSYLYVEFSESQVNPGFLMRGSTPVVFIVGPNQTVVGFFVIGGRNSS
jgi:hypothetical protein